MFDLFEWFAESLKSAILKVFSLPYDPEARIFGLYVLTSVIVAYFVFRTIKARGRDATEIDREYAEGSFLQFLFPKRVWSHPSAWLDVRYLVFHRVASYFLLFGTAAWSISLGYKPSSGGVAFTEAYGQSPHGFAVDVLISTVFMVIVFAVTDFIAWAIHYFQHKVPFLWQFHKVHHSAEVMHPISNYREHPVDNLAYGVLISLGFGVLFGLAARNLGYLPSMPALLGVPALMFAFNVFGYNLRHSHVWLKWPGVWSKVFPSPAHHHIHHSRHPDHIDKNFAFMFPVWDVIFGTYHMPEDNRDVEFGIDEDASELNSCWNLYWIPVRDAFRLVRAKIRRPRLESDGDRATPAE